MRVALCVKRDIFGLLAARAFVRTIAPSRQALRVFCSVKTRPAEDQEPLPRLLKSLERDFPIDTLLAAATDRPAGGHDVLSADRWHVLRDLRPQQGAADLLGWQPDIIVSIRFSLIFPQHVIDAVPAGILNVHPGPLPEYRGLYAPFWQIMNGEDRLRATLHLVDRGIDTGAVVGTHDLRRHAGRSLLWHIGELYRGGAALAARTVLRTASGEPPAALRQPQSGRYWRIPTPAEAEAFLRGPMPVVTTADYLELLREALLPDAAEAQACLAAS